MSSAPFSAVCLSKQPNCLVTFFAIFPLDGLLGSMLFKIKFKIERVNFTCTKDVNIVIGSRTQSTGKMVSIHCPTLTSGE